MKIRILTLLFLIPLLAGAQVIPEGTTDIWQVQFPMDSTGNITYREVIEVKDKSKDELYLSAKEWFAATFKDSKQVLEIDDKEAGVLVGSGWSNIDGQVIDIKLWQTIKIETKDGKYRYTVTDFKLQSYPTIYNADPPTMDLEDSLFAKPDIKKAARKPKESILIQINGLVYGLKKGMNEAGKEDQW